MTSRLNTRNLPDAGAARFKWKARAMLKGKLLHPQILDALGRAGHLSKVLIADGNYPFSTRLGPRAAAVYLNLSPGRVNCVETLEALRDRVREDLQRGAEHDAEHAMRHELVKELASRMTTPPDVLVEQEVDRRLEEFVRRLVDQGIDPMKVEIDWREFRVRQRDAAAETVRSTLVIDDIARRESIDATEDDVNAVVAAASAAFLARA